MAGLSTLDEMLGISPIRSVGDFKSPDARSLAARYNILLPEIPELRKRLHDRGDGALEHLIAEGKLSREEAAKMLAAEAMFFYEKAARVTGFKLVGPELGLGGVVAELYGRVTSVNPNAVQENTAFGKLYARKAAQ